MEAPSAPETIEEAGLSLTFLNDMILRTLYIRGVMLGLDLARRIIVEKHHGDLRVRSEPGNTKFVVLLPLVAPAPEVTTPTELPASAE